MKKTFAILLSLMMVTSIVLTGCGKAKEEPANDELDSSSTPIVENDKNDNDVDNTEDDTDADNNGDTENNPELEAIVDQAKDQMASMTEALGDSVELDISVRGNALVYTYNYKIDIDKETIEANLDPIDSMMNTVLSAIQAQEIENASIIIEYFNADGEEVFTKEYK